MVDRVEANAKLPDFQWIFHFNAVFNLFDSLPVIRLKNSIIKAHEGWALEVR